MNGFQFKQFSIEHANCAMKVGTDSILLGSWVNTRQAKRILDIGTGSGLLAIMMAQKSTADTQVLGIDIDDGAVTQASKNMRNCPWSERLSCQKVDVANLSVDAPYDLIISNPPYFTLPPRSSGKRRSDIEDTARRSARHHSDLDPATLFQQVARLLDPQGHFYCVLPSHSQDILNLAKQHGLYCHRLTHVHSATHKPAIRQLLEFSNVPSQCLEQQLAIHQSSGQYSAEYRQLCQDFYLKF
ncbi:tRNA1(Val) (adenine(37)-N6)-methyltransferase [Aliiglaciecola litoralis]|uniref:tRNA1(Val) (adenine(37)-N6)-methyltransferase n=1 Tax=Aliiglaciecola litoralis TaxID=582857 RepID=A0ABP3WP06_9ALTE